MPTKQGHLQERGTSNPFAPKTLDTLVKDTVRNRALSQSLTKLLENTALGFPEFTTTTAYAVDDKVFHDRKLWKFTAAHAAGACRQARPLQTGHIGLLLCCHVVDVRQVGVELDGEAEIAKDEGKQSHGDDNPSLPLDSYGSKAGKQVWAFTI